MGIQDCVYIKKKGTGKALRMGEACKSCRCVRTDMKILRATR